MCGRIVLSVAPHRIAEEFFLDMVPETVPRWNIAPTQDVLGVVPNPASEGNLARPFRWGLVPHWSDGPDTSARMINARSETVLDKGAFRESFRQRRCLVPVDGFYEWQKRPDGKQPFVFRPRAGDLLALAAIWDRWEYPGGRTLESCSILTTAANSVMRPVHHRMPVILDPAAWTAWLRTPADETESLLELLTPAAPDVLRTAPVSRQVNSPSFDGPACIEPIWDDPGGQMNLFE